MRRGAAAPWHRLLAGLALAAGMACAAAPAAPAAPASAAAQQGAIRWLVQDVPPHFAYRDGRPPRRADDLGAGELDGFLRLLIARLPQWRHEFVEASFPRFEALVRGGEPLCSMLHVRTPERLDWLYFINLYPTPASRQIHVVLRRDRLDRIRRNGQLLSLAELLERPDLSLLLPQDRSFGARIDALLRAHPEHLAGATINSRSLQLMAMLAAGRMDYTLEYPSVVDEYRRSSGEDRLLALPLAEGISTPYATASCGRSPEGRRRIVAIDRALRELAADPQRDRWLHEWRGERLDGVDRPRLLHYLDGRARDGAQIE